jgi:hypothetical protein
VAGDDAGDDVREVGLGLHAHELAGLDQRSDDRPVFGPPSDPAKSAFLRVSASGRIER